MAVMTTGHALIPTGRPSPAPGRGHQEMDAARFTDLRSKNRPTPPVMVGEVLSRSTRLHDRNTRKAHHERTGVPVYWLLDPTEPGSPTAPEHTGSGYEQVAHVVGDEEYSAQRPFPVTVVPARRLDGTRP